MPGRIHYLKEGTLARVVLENPGKFNSITRTMWRELRWHFESIQSDQTLRCVVVQGSGEHFCSGGDIEEYPSFRFSEASLRDFHENYVWGGLNAMLQCDVPIIAVIGGYCMGAGLEIASTCDLRLGSDMAKFGAPIGRLGFPMAQKEAALVADAVGASAARAMLLAGAVLGADQMLRCGFLNELCGPPMLAMRGQALVQAVSGLAPQAARRNKQTLRAHYQQKNSVMCATEAEGSGCAGQPAHEGTQYDYASAAEHREGIEAFLSKRKPEF